MNGKMAMSVVLILGLAPSAMAEKNPATISVAGTHVTKVVPDTVVWNITRTDEDPDLGKAKAGSDRNMMALMNMLGEMGVDGKDINSGSLEIRKVYHRDERGNRGPFRYFRVNRRMTVRQHDLTRFDEFLERLVGTAEIEVYPQLESSEIHAIRRENRLKAVVIAKQKATDMLNELGGKLGKPLSISENFQSGGTRQFVSNNMVTQMPSNPEDDVVSGTFAPGTIDIRTTVYVTFEIG